METIIEQAEYIGQSVNFPAVNDLNPIINVFNSLSLSNDAENTNSPYIAINEKKNITTDIDLVNGSIILVNTCHVVAPSTLAASSNSLGSPSIYPFISQILYALPAQSINDKEYQIVHSKWYFISNC